MSTTILICKPSQLTLQKTGLFAPTLTGFIIQETGMYSAAFVVTGVLGVAGALAVLFFVRDRSHDVKEGVVVTS